jgi:hypothetical protein
MRLTLEAPAVPLATANESAEPSALSSADELELDEELPELEPEFEEPEP